jgi:hypothetical protein
MTSRRVPRRLRASVAPVSDPLFRLACAPAALDSAPAGWVRTMLEEGELAVLADAGGLDAITALAHGLDLVVVPVLRAEQTPAQQEATVFAYAAAKPLVWVAASFSEDAADWAHRRGPMTLLIESDGPLPEGERKRVERFAVILGRQAE